jgi:hypothetical protein
MLYSQCASAQSATDEVSNHPWTMAYFSFVAKRTTMKATRPAIFSSRVCIRCRDNVFSDPLPINDSGLRLCTRTDERLLYRSHALPLAEGLADTAWEPSKSRTPPNVVHLTTNPRFVFSFSLPLSPYIYIYIYERQEDNALLGPAGRQTGRLTAGRITTLTWDLCSSPLRCTQVRRRIWGMYDLTGDDSQAHRQRGDFISPILRQ